MIQPCDFVHRFVPSPSGSAATVILLLHGTGGNEEDLLPLGRELSDDAALLSPRGKVLENGAPRFFRRLAEGVFDLEDVKARAAELATFVDCALDEYSLRGARVVAVGYSNGANIAAVTMLLHPGRIHAAALLRAMVVLEPPAAPDLSGTDVLISSGITDPIVPASHVHRLADIFRTAGAAVDVKEQQASHGLVRSDIFDCAGWLARISQR
ncbi:MAG TPA: alpha/beta hydrolase [Gemmatimonadaceae bacterium]|nr:alpha/beta hydrolase [Gemmatimonadaceae bacterium]